VRTLPGPVSAGIAAGATPDVKVELIDWALHYADLFISGPSGRNGAAVAADGTLVQVYNDGAGNIKYRRVADPSQVSWGAFSSLTSTANVSGVVCLAKLSDRLRVLWPDSATTNVVYRDSFDSGVTWSAAANLFDAGAAVAGISADASPNVVFVLYQVGINWRVAIWTFTVGWSRGDWSRGDFPGAGGIGVCSIVGGGGSYIVVVSLDDGTGGGFALYSTIWTGPWSTLVTVFANDVAAGLTIQDPHVTYYDGLYHCCTGVVDTGSISGFAYTRASLQHSTDGVHWSDPLEDAGAFAHGGTALKHAVGYLIVGPDTSSLALPYTASASQYRDCTADVASMMIRQRDGSPAKLVISLMNESNQYVGLAALRRNARMRISLGFAGAGVVYAFVFYIDSFRFSVVADDSVLMVEASDLRGFLNRQVRTSLVYANQSVDWLTRELLARAGIFTMNLAATSQFSQNVLSFSVVAGSSYAAAMRKVSTIYGYSAAARTAADGTDSVVVIEKTPADASAWSYGSEFDSFIVSRDGARGNHILVWGAPASPPNVGEAWDFADVADVGQERFVSLVETHIGSSAGAVIAANLALQIEQRAALSGQLVVFLHPGLELWDVVTVVDARVGTVLARVLDLTHRYDGHTLEYSLSLGLEGR
jgi:hypothetical protein